MIYRKEIDGLRALAVVPVILFHAGFVVFEGGYVGVDIFFVISGYLITSIIINDIASSNFSLSNFYERRARRILPPLYLVMLVSTFFVFANYSPFNAKDFYQSLVATTLFLSNYFFYLETDYFNDFSETAPLLHTWSLAVEEQFYLVFPFFLIFISRFKYSLKISLIILLCISSLIFSFFESSINSTANFYLLQSRFWELLIGSLIALVMNHDNSFFQNFQTRLVSNLFSFLGIGLILFAILTFDYETTFPGINALYPTIGTGLLIIFLNPQTILYKFFSFPPLVYIGLLSYSLYLWHQPIFAISRSYSLSSLSSSTYFILIGLSLFLSFLSYKYVETPFRNKKVVTRNILIPVLLSCALFFISFGYIGHSKDGFRDLIYTKYSSNSSMNIIDKEFELNKRTAIWKELLKNSSKSFSKNLKHKILIVGDSKSEDLFVSMKLSKYFNKEYQIARLELNDACMHAHRDNKKLSTDCLEDLEKFKKFLKNNSPDTIIFSNTWTGRYNRNVSKFISNISDSNNVIVFSTANFNDMADVSLEIARRNIENPRRFIFQNIKQDHLNESNDLKSLLESSAAIFIEKLEFFCDFEIQECNILDSKPLIYDSGHLTDHGAIFFGNKLQDIDFKNIELN